MPLKRHQADLADTPDIRKLALSNPASVRHIIRHDDPENKGDLLSESDLWQLLFDGTELPRRERPSDICDVCDGRATIGSRDLDTTCLCEACNGMLLARYHTRIGPSGAWESSVRSALPELGWAGGHLWIKLFGDEWWYRVLPSKHTEESAGDS